MSAFGPAPSGAVSPPRRCLFGVTILLIEDSRAASEALRLFAIESGARLRRADSLASAHRHLAIYRPQVVIVDLGLPDGSGLDLIRALAGAPIPFTGIVALSGNERGSWEAEARDAGAAAILEKPIPSLRAFQECILSLLPDQGVLPAMGAETAAADERLIEEALEADLRRALHLLEEAVPVGDADTIAYCAQFLVSLNRNSTDAALARAARAAEAAGGHAAGLVAGGAELVAALRARLGRTEARGAA